MSLTERLDEPCHSLRDFLTVLAAARLAGGRDPLGDAIDAPLDLVGDEA